MKRRLVGAALLIPLAAVIPSMVKSCHQGGDVRMANGSIVDSLLTIVLMLGVPMALVGLVLLFGKPKR